MTALYIIAGLSAAIVALIGYIKVKSAQNKVLETNNKSLSEAVDKSTQTAEQLQHIAEHVAEVQEVREEKHRQEQAEIDTQHRRNHFDSETF